MDAATHQYQITLITPSCQTKNSNTKLSRVVGTTRTPKLQFTQI